MTLTRIYKYRIRPGCESRYLNLQEEVLRLYRKHAEVDVLFLRDAKDQNQRTEVIRFFGPNAEEDISRIDNDPKILELFSNFQNEILDPEHPAISEETLYSDPLSATGKLHHVEIYSSDLKRSTEFWTWFLEILGYRQFQKWSGGISFRSGDTYLVFVQADERFLSVPFHRCRPGLNHLAFHAASQSQVDQVAAQLRKRGTKILYEDQPPRAGGSSSYAVFFEDPERIKVELVASRGQDLHEKLYE